MKALAAILVALTLTGCNSPGVLRSLPYPEVLPVKCDNGRWAFRNPNKPTSNVCAQVYGRQLG